MDGKRDGSGPAGGGGPASKRPRGPVPDGPPPEVDPEEEAELMAMLEEEEADDGPPPPASQEEAAAAPLDLGEAAKNWPRPELAPIDPRRDALGDTVPPPLPTTPRHAQLSLAISCRQLEAFVRIGHELHDRARLCALRVVSPVSFRTCPSRPPH